MRCDVLYSNGKVKTVQYARFKIERKLGRSLRKNETVDHIDDDKTNDKLSNLQVLTLGANAGKSANPKAVIKYVRSRAGRQASKERQTGENNISAVFTDEQVLEFRLQYTQALVDRVTIMKITGASRRTVFNMLTGVSYSHLGNACQLDRKR